MERLAPEDRPRDLGALQAWFNVAEWSGVESAQWVTWISNTQRKAVIWGATPEIALREALPVVMPAALRREGFLDGHGALLAPDPQRPDDGVFVTGLSGSGKSTLTVSATLAGARLLSDDSVAIGFDEENLRAWPRRPILALSIEMGELLVPDAVGREVDGKLVFSAKRNLGQRYADSLRVRAVVLLQRGSDCTEISRVEKSVAYSSLLMGHPILAMDSGARPCFKVVRALADLPAYRMSGGRDLLDPGAACATLARLLPRE